MNLYVIELTWDKIQIEAGPQKTSKFIKQIIWNWRDNCKTRKVPQFKRNDKININISTNTEERKAIKQIMETNGFNAWQLIEVAWWWHKFSEEQEDK